MNLDVLARIKGILATVSVANPYGTRRYVTVNGRLTGVSVANYEEAFRLIGREAEGLVTDAVIDTVRASFGIRLPRYKVKKALGI
jgi:hypothetical protein